MGIKAHYLQDKDGNKMYPYGHADAVFDRNGNKLGTIIDGLGTSITQTLSEATNYTDTEINELSERVVFIEDSDTTEMTGALATSLTTGHIVDNLNSTLNTMVLSAKQGKVLNERISNIISHNNDTDGNTELVDARVDVNGKTHSSAGDAIRNQIGQLSSEIDNVYKVTPINDTENLSDGFMYDGVPTTTASSEGWKYTDFIPCKYGDSIWCAKVWGNIPCLSFFDKDKNFLYQITLRGASSGEIVSSEYTVLKENVEYFVFNIFPNSPTDYLILKQYISPPTQPDVYYVGKNASKYDFTTLKECTEHIRKFGILNATVFVDGGEYDLYSEFGADYFNSLPTSGNADLGEMYGLYVGNNTHFVFTNRAKITFNYDGSNWATSMRFSPLNIYGSVVLENCIIECTNCRYCVHEDLATIGLSDSEGYNVKYINCYFKHNGNPVQGYSAPLCVGAGTHRLSNSLIVGGRFECEANATYPYTILYHNTNTEDETNVTIKDIYSNKGIWFNTSVAGKNTIHCNVINSKIVGGIVCNGNAIDLIEWNNAVE